MSRQCLVLLLTHESNYAGIVLVLVLVLLGILRVEFGVVQRPENLVIIANSKNFAPLQFIWRVYYYCNRNNSVWMVSILSGRFQYCYNFNSLQTVLILSGKFCPDGFNNVLTVLILYRQF